MCRTSRNMPEAPSLHLCAPCYYRTKPADGADAVAICAVDNIASLVGQVEGRVADA